MRRGRWLDVPLADLAPVWQVIFAALWVAASGFAFLAAVAGHKFLHWLEG
jgi:hypothetical protein